MPAPATRRAGMAQSASFPVATVRSIVPVETISHPIGCRAESYSAPTAVDRGRRGGNAPAAVPAGCAAGRDRAGFRSRSARVSAGRWPAAGPSGRRSPAASGRPACPPRRLGRCVDRLPNTGSNVDAAGNRQIARARRASEPPHREVAAPRHRERCAEGGEAVADGHDEVGAAKRHGPLVLELEFRSRSVISSVAAVRVIADQRVGHPMRAQIHRA